MGRYCPNCHQRVSQAWYVKYRFCDDYCKKVFIKDMHILQIPHGFNDSKSKRQIRRKQYARN
jgi:uncharacterized protein with WD repeat